ncbi:MAG: hypothetical protein V4472_24975 [Pseudomonadota bacterium]
MSMPSDPVGPMAESASAAHELFLAYKNAGFDEHQALELVKVVVATVGSQMVGVAFGDPSAAYQEAVRRRAVERDERGRFAGQGGGPTEGTSCAVCHGPFYYLHGSGQVGCPDHPPGPRFMGGQPT